MIQVDFGLAVSFSLHFNKQQNNLLQFANESAIVCLVEFVTMAKLN